MTCRCVRIVNFLARRGVGQAAYLVAVVIHPLIHGTPLDGGALDAGLLWLQAWAVTPSVEVD